MHYEPMAQGGWTSAGRLDALARRHRWARRFPAGSPTTFRAELARQVSRRTFRRRCSPRRSRPRAASTLVRSRDPARSGSRSSCLDVVRVVESVARRGARSIRPRRSTHRPVTCVASSIAPTETSPARSPPTTMAGRGARKDLAARHARLRLDILRRFGGSAVLPIIRGRREHAFRPACSGRAAARVTRIGEAKRVISRSPTQGCPVRVDMPPQGSCPYRGRMRALFSTLVGGVLSMHTDPDRRSGQRRPPGPCPVWPRPCACSSPCSSSADGAGTTPRRPSFYESPTYTATTPPAPPTPPVHAWPPAGSTDEPVWEEVSAPPVSDWPIEVSEPEASAIEPEVEPEVEAFQSSSLTRSSLRSRSRSQSPSSRRSSPRSRSSSPTSRRRRTSRSPQRA